MNAVEELYQENVKELRLCEARLRALISQAKDPLLKESKFAKDHRRALIKEAILHERLTLLEAAGQDPHEIADTMDGMMMSAGMLANRIGAEGLSSRLDSIHVPDVYELDAMSVDKGKLKQFMKTFADVAVMTKGLLALASEVGEQEGGLSGPVGEVFKTLQMAAGPAAEGSLGQALFAYDNATSPMKKGGFGRGKRVSMQKKFGDAIMNTLRTKAPGAVKLLDPASLVANMLKVPMKQLIRSFRAYDAGVKHYVDNDMLMSLTKGPGGIMGVLKGLSDMFQSGGAAPGGRR